MMNPLIKNQLDKLRKMGFPAFNESDRVITLNKRENALDSILREGQCYLISVEDYILNPPEGFTLHTNWNNNVVPKFKFMKIDVLQIMGKMIKVTSMGYDMHTQKDIPEMWSGWLPQKSITIIERL